MENYWIYYSEILYRIDRLLFVCLKKDKIYAIIKLIFQIFRGDIRKC